jgi:L-arabinokinase
VTVLFYISGHGFGHASRQVEVLNALGARGGHRLVIRSAVSPALFARTLRVPYELISGECDSGIVQATSVEHDEAATVEAAKAFYATFPARVDAEIAAVGGLDAGLIVGDIPPIAFEAGTRLGVPSVALANFTWDWIYEGHPGFLPGAAPVIEIIRAAYRRATRALALPMSAGFEVFHQVTPLPMIARRPTQTPEATRAHFGLPARGKVALVSFGGYGMPALGLGRLDCLDWTVVTTDRSVGASGTPRGIVRLADDRAFSRGFRYEDLVAAADAVITKPGYGIIAECIAGTTAMLYTSRGSFREYELLVSAMPRFLRCRFISQRDLFRGAWRESLEAVLSDPDPPERPALNGADVAAEILERMGG